MMLRDFITPTHNNGVLENGGEKSCYVTVASVSQAGLTKLAGAPLCHKVNVFFWKSCSVSIRPQGHKL